MTIRVTNLGVDIDLVPPALPRVTNLGVDIDLVLPVRPRVTNLALDVDVEDPAKKHVLLVVDSESNASTTNNLNAIKSLGHSVSVVLRTNLTIDHMRGADVTVLSRIPADATLAGVVRQGIDAGCPVVIGQTVMSSAGTGQTLLGTLLNLCGTGRTEDSSPGWKYIDIVDTTHAVTEGLATGALQIHSSGNWGQAIEGSYVGTLLAESDPNSTEIVNLPSTVAIEAGTNDLQGQPIGARVVIATWVYAGQSAYTSQAVDLLDRILRWVTAPAEPPPPPPGQATTMRRGPLPHPARLVPRVPAMRAVPRIR